MDEETITEDSQLEESSEELAVSEADKSAEEKQADESESQDTKPSLTLEQINEALGKEFKDIDTALKSLKDTNEYVGKRKEKIVEEVKDKSGKEIETLSQEVSQLRKENFYQKNPQYKEYESLIEKIGGEREEVIKSKEFKTVFDKLSSVETPNQKSVLHSNSEVSNQSGDYQKDFEKARETHNWSEFLAKHKGVTLNEE